MAGNCRAVRAARIRLKADSSDRCSSCTQYRNIEGKPAGTYSRRASTSLSERATVFAARWGNERHRNCGIVY